MRVAFLGPSGTFNSDALKAAAGDDPITEAPAASIYDAILAVENREAERALVPFENSVEGSVRATLDTLAFDTAEVVVVGEFDFPIRTTLMAREQMPLSEVEVVLSHPQANAQCARFIRENLSEAEVRAAPSTAEAARQVSESEAPWAALGAAGAAELYGCAVLQEGVEDEPDNVTRFVWLAPAGTEPGGGGDWKTSLVFAELGDDHPGALVEALAEFSSRGVNLSRIESRPLRRGLGRYMFFLDIEGAADAEDVSAALEGLRGKAESVRLLGSYPLQASGIP